MDELVAFRLVGRVLLGCKSGQTFFEDVNPQWIDACHEDIDPQIKLVAVDEERVGNIPRNDREIVNIDLCNVINDVNAASSRHVSGLDDPQVALGILILKLLEMIVEVAEFIWDDVGVRKEVKVLLSKLLLHLVDIQCQFVLPRYLEALWKVVDFLVFVETFIEVGLA